MESDPTTHFTFAVKEVEDAESLLDERIYKLCRYVGLFPLTDSTALDKAQAVEYAFRELQIMMHRLISSVEGKQ